VSAYLKILNLLEALPPGDRKLAAYEYLSADGCRCVIGHASPTAAGLNPSDKRIGLLMAENEDIAIELDELGIGKYEAVQLQMLNDSFYTSKEERYYAVVETLRKWVEFDAVKSSHWTNMMGSMM
jgi:hypothetical protein